MWIDLLALGFFIFCWVGYAAFSNYKSERRACFMNVSRRLRQMWIIAAYKRGAGQRQVDVLTSSGVSRNASFFASTSVLVLAGTLASFQALDGIYQLVNQIDYSFIPNKSWFYSRILLLAVIFTFSFFQFSWTLIQFNQGSIALAAIDPTQKQIDGEKLEKNASNIAELFALAGRSFNEGIRAYYFAIAALAWFYHPIAFMAMSVLIVLILYRRDFHSNTLKAMLNCLE